MKENNLSAKNISSSNEKKELLPKNKLTGLQKSAIFLISMGQEASSEILKHLSEEEIMEMAKIKKIDNELKESILKEFQAVTNKIAQASKGGKDFAKQVLQNSFGDDKANEIMKKVEQTEKPLQSINRADPEKIATVVRNEHPQTIAIVIAFLEPKVGAKVLSHLPEELKPEVVKRIAQLKKSNKDIIKTIESTIIAKLQALPEKTEKTGGVDAIANILNSGISDKVRNKILDNLEDSEPELVNDIKRKLVKFEDIVFLLDRDVQLILSKVEVETIAKALKLANDSIRDKIISNVSKRVYEEYIDPILNKTPVKVSEIEASQGEIVKVMRELIQSQTIFFSNEYIQ
jgi:flagellar motor switch protein FliG